MLLAKLLYRQWYCFDSVCVFWGLRSFFLVTVIATTDESTVDTNVPPNSFDLSGVRLDAVLSMSQHPYQPSHIPDIHQDHDNSFGGYRIWNHLE